MAIKNVNELEFIGESLPKINGNFSELDQRVQNVENISSEYSSLSSFYSTHSNNELIDFNLGSTPILFGNQNILKDNIYSANAGVSDFTKIIYPAVIDLRIENTLITSDVDYTIKITKTEGASPITFITNRVPRAYDVDKPSKSFITFTDLGYYDWLIVISGATAQTKVSWSLKLLS